MVVHGDIKADNILVSEFGIPQINDFDMARILDIEGFSTETWRDARFNAPELLTPGRANSIPPTFQSDVFSLGILFLQIFHGHDESGFPYNHIGCDGYDPQFMNLVRGGERPIRDRYRAMSNGHWELLCYCWKGNPVERPNISQVVHAL
jgi:serine/threonine protein kinase